MTKWILLVPLLSLLAVVGVGLYVTDFTAYLGNNPTTCNNCHVMDAVYESWYHAAHKPWATCADCHTPHALIPKYWVKAESGYHHVTAFVLGDIPAAIRAKESSRKIVQENCVRCHQTTVSTMFESPQPLDRYCFDCHRDVAHGERGISLLPYQHTEEYR
ncbi:MAG: Cytochrome c nitrite reductase, small subunit NrfH [Anaerolineae bacterium]|jgi:cytochrome c nitrite reductase small subunit|nr:MAG: Cytochrome c nitrite reductase, small subunit NrfH [Anaerolineae bacterium]